MKTITIDDLLACSSLPSLPTIAVKVLELSRRETTSIEEIAAVVHNDPALTAKVLKTVNSSFYGLAKPCPTISRALSYLGLSTLKSLVLGFSLVKVSKGGKAGFDLTNYWRRSMYAAAAARRVAFREGASDPDEAFAAALMQDLGMLAIHALLGSDYAEVIAAAGDHRRLPDAERRAFGFDHAEVGARLGERWNLASQLVTAIRFHHAGIPSEDLDLSCHVALGSEIAAVMTLPNPGPAVARLRERSEEQFGYGADEVDELLKSVAGDVRELGSLFEVSTGDAIDVNWILAEAEEASVQHQIALEREAESLRKSNDELARRVVTDELTDVGNRARFDEELVSRFEQAVSFHGSVGLILADIDRFKVVNDRYGHQAGDAVLVELAARLKKAVRGMDLVCRYGGEEFAVILPGASVLDVASIAERLRVSVEKSNMDAGGGPGLEDGLEITISLGGAVYDRDTEKVLNSPALLVKAADQALYVAKDSGRNCVRVFQIDGRAAA